jgi:hypothetical protein
MEGDLIAIRVVGSAAIEDDCFIGTSRAIDTSIRDRKAVGIFVDGRAILVTRASNEGQKDRAGDEAEHS